MNTMGLKMTPVKLNAGKDQRDQSMNAELDILRRSGRKGMKDAILNQHDPEAAATMGKTMVENMDNVVKNFEKSKPKPLPGFEAGRKLRPKVYDLGRTLKELLAGSKREG